MANRKFKMMKSHLKESPRNRKLKLVLNLNVEYQDYGVPPPSRHDDEGYGGNDYGSSGNAY
jgi:hypothetical protein